MDSQNVTPEVAQPEISNTTQPEMAPIAEQIPSSPIEPPVILNKEKDLEILRVTQNDNATGEVSPEEVADLSSSDVEPADNNWIGKVREVIAEDKNQPFKEEEDSEDLNEAYMKERFGVNIDEEDK